VTRLSLGDRRSDASASRRANVQSRSSGRDGALVNLMLNGIEAMRGTGGELIVISKRTEHGRLLISVSDTGVGVSVTDVERIFEALLTIKLQGTGLGWSISRRMIEWHRGHLWTGANTGRGTIFQSSLPVKSRVHEFVRLARSHRPTITNRIRQRVGSAPID
jgi:C4-dicarboxylate-specific signal transduction histidine kinase